MYDIVFAMFCFDPYSWQSLVHKNYEIEQVCLDLQQEVDSLKEQARERYSESTIMATSNKNTRLYKVGNFWLEVLLYNECSNCISACMHVSVLS